MRTHKKIIWITWVILGIFLFLDICKVLLLSDKTMNFLIWTMMSLIFIDLGFDAKKENKKNKFILFSIVVPIVTSIVLLATISNLK